MQKTNLPFHPRVAAGRQQQRQLLSLRDSTAMAVGGMIGGGIFSVLGVTISIAGHLAIGCFLLGGAIALMTAHSFAVLSLQAGKSGGLFVYLREAGYPRLGAMASWLLIFGYVVALAVYAYTFGHYAAHAFSLSVAYARGFSVAVMAAFLSINLRGVSASARTEDAVVLIKVLILAVIAFIGILHFSPGRLSPLDNQGISSVFVGATTIFVAYEGFELLSYDYDDIQRPRITLPRALYLSVAIVTLIYVVVTIGSQMLVGDNTIVKEKEVAFAAVGKAAVGGVGIWVATAAALLATSSAINATLFSTARQIHEIAREHELPGIFSKSRSGLPAYALVLLAVSGAVFAMLPGILQLLSFGSAVFLVVFGLTNYLAYKAAKTLSQKVITGTATLSCLAAIIILFIQLINHDHATLYLTLVSTAVVVAARLVFVRTRSSAATSSY